MLKKNKLKPHLRQQYVIPPEHNAEFGSCMEKVRCAQNLCASIVQAAYQPAIATVAYWSSPAVGLP